MRAIFTEELHQVADNVDQMATLVKQAISNAGVALLQSDVETAQSLIDGDLAIDKLEHEVIDQCIQLLAKQNPVATDLRVVVSTIRLVTTLERMGDLSRHIAEIARRAYPNSAITEQARPIYEGMQDYMNETAEMLVTMLVNRDTKIAEEIITGDNLLNALHRKGYEMVMSDAWQGSKQETIDMVLLSRFYERMGDHAASIARRVIYIVSGFDPSKEPEQLGIDPD